MSWPAAPESIQIPIWMADKDRALQRLGWAILAIEDGRLHIAELHLAEATAALQAAQRLKE